MSTAPWAFLDSARACVAHASWQAAVLGLIVLVLSWLLGGRLEPRWRLGLWLVVFARLALPVVATAPWSLFRLSVAIQARPAAVQLPVAPRGNPPTDMSASPFSQPAAPFHEPTIDTPPPVGNSADAVGQPAPHWSWWVLPWLSVLWLAGMLLLLVRSIWLGRRLARRLRTWRPVTDPRIRAEFETCRRELGVRRRVGLLNSPEPVGPATGGVFSPCVVLPEQRLAQFPSEELRLVLLHELVHIRRHDVLLDRVAGFLVAVHWFNPVAWLALRFFRRERELVCDAAVLDHVGAQEAGLYGRVILKVMEHLAAPAPWAGAVGVFGRDVPLAGRIRMIASYRKPKLAGVVLGSVLLFLTVALGLTDAAAERPGKPAPGNPDQPTSNPSREGTTEQARDQTIAGVCVDEEGHPVKGARAAVYRMGYADSTRELLREATSDGGGRFRFAGLPALRKSKEPAESWHYALVVTRKGRASSILPFYEGTRTDDFTIKMPPAATLSGRVTDPAGKPIAGAAVWIDCLMGDPLEGVLSARTDADGRYAITDMHPWDADKVKPTDHGNGTMSRIAGCFFGVRHPDYGYERPMYTRVPDAIDVTLEPAAVVEGRVLDRVTGKPAAGVVVHLLGILGTSGGAWRLTRTDEDGKYRFNCLVAARYTVSAEAPDRACTAVDSFAVVAGKTYALPDLQLEEGSWIEGRLVDAETGKPITCDPQGKRLYVALFGPSHPKSTGARSSAVDDQGAFRFRVAPGVNYPFISFGDVWQRTQRREFYEKGIDVKPGEIVFLTFRILPRKPLPDPDPAPVRLAIPVPPERAAAAAVRDLGGWYQVDEDHHVVEVNMVYHATPAGGRFNNSRTDTDEGLRTVGAFPRLKQLFLTKGQATDDGLQTVAGLTGLEVLMVWDAEKLTDAGIKHLAGLANLKNVHFSNSRIGDGALAVFGRLPGLQHLALQGNSFSDDGLKHLAGMKQLKSLWVGMNQRPLSDAGVQHLSGLTALESLDLQHAHLSDAGVANLKDLKQLRTLFLTSDKKDGESSVTDAGVDHLLALTKLETLHINDSGLSEQGVRRLAELPNLKKLAVTSTRPFSPGLRAELEKKRPGVWFNLIGAPRS